MDSRRTSPGGVPEPGTGAGKPPRPIWTARGRLLLPTLLALLLASSPAVASTVGPPPAPGSSTGGCPSGVIQGYQGTDGALVGLFQVQPITDNFCLIEDGGTLFSTSLVVYLYTPFAPPSSQIPIALEEFSTGHQTVSEPGPNNTTIEHVVPVQENVVWSNASVPAATGGFLAFQLYPPPRFSPENLTLSLVGVTLHLTVDMTPFARILGPVSYGDELLHDTWSYVGAAVALALALGAARLITRHLRYVREVRLPAGLFAVGVILFGVWAFTDPVDFADLVGNLPTWWVLVPVFVLGTIVYVAIWPGKAYIFGVDQRCEDLRAGFKTRRIPEIRATLRGGRVQEYLPVGIRATLGRLIGIRWRVDDRVLTQSPHWVANPDWESVRHDVLAWCFTWSRTLGDGGHPPEEDVPPRIWWFPWRKRALEARAEHWRVLGLDPAKMPAPRLILSVDDGVHKIYAVDEQVAVLADGYTRSTLKVSEMGEVVQRTKTALLTTKLAWIGRAHRIAEQLATVSRIGQRIPESEISMRAAEELAEQREADLFDTGTYLRHLRERHAPAPAAKPVTPAAGETPDAKGSP